MRGKHTKVRRGGTSPHSVGLAKVGKRRGFTLMEMMIVLAVIAIAVTLAAPAISNATRERRAGESTLDLVRLARRARSEAMAYGRAYLMRYTEASAPSYDVGRVQLYRGRSSGCNSNDWDSLADGILRDAIACPALGAAEASSFCVDQVNLENSDYSRQGAIVQMRLLPPTGAGFRAVDLCYEPTGVMRHRSSNDAGTPPTGWFREANGFDYNNDGDTSDTNEDIGGGFLFEFRRMEGDPPAEVGVMRRVVIPLGGDARVLR